MTLTAQENTDGAWAGPGRSGGGSNYDEWKFYDNSNLAQCFDKECSSGEGKKLVLYYLNDTQNTIICSSENQNLINIKFLQQKDTTAIVPPYRDLRLITTMLRIHVLGKGGHAKLKTKYWH